MLKDHDFRSYVHQHRVQNHIVQIYFYFFLLWLLFLRLAPHTIINVGLKKMQV